MPTRRTRRAWDCSHLAGSRTRPERAEEACPLAGVAGAAALLLDDEQQRVHVAVVVRGAHPLAVARRVALAPVLLAAPAPEPGAALLEGAAERFGVHPREHEHAPGAVLLDDGGNEPVGVEGEGGELLLGGDDRRCGGHR